MVFIGTGPLQCYVLCVCVLFCVFFQLFFFQSCYKTRLWFLFLFMCKFCFQPQLHKRHQSWRLQAAANHPLTLCTLVPTFVCVCQVHCAAAVKTSPGRPPADKRRRAGISFLQRRIKRKRDEPPAWPGLSDHFRLFVLDAANDSEGWCFIARSVLSHSAMLTRDLAIGPVDRCARAWTTQTEKEKSVWACGLETEALKTSLHLSAWIVKTSWGRISGGFQCLMWLTPLDFFFLFPPNLIFFFK